jgi:hypothetical protein
MHPYEEEDTCPMPKHPQHIHPYEEEDTCPMHPYEEEDTCPMPKHPQHGATFFLLSPSFVSIR